VWEIRRGPSSLLLRLTCPAATLFANTRSPDGKWLFFGGSGTALHKYSTAAVRTAARSAQSSPSPSKLSPISFSLSEATGKTRATLGALACFHKKSWIAIAVDNELVVVDFESFQIVDKLPAIHSKSCFGICVANDDSWMASVAFDGQLIMWQTSLTLPENATYHITDKISNSNLFKSYRAIQHKTAIRTIDISKCSSYVVGGTNAGEVYVWEAATGAVYQKFSFPDCVINHCLFSNAPGLKVISTRSGKGLVSITDCASENAKPSQLWEARTTGSAYAIAQSPDGDIVVVGSETTIRCIVSSNGKFVRHSHPPDSPKPLPLYHYQVMCIDG